MELTEIYRTGEEVLRGKEFGRLLDAVETGFITRHDRKILDRYTFRPRYIDGVHKPDTSCEVLGVKLSTPVIMSAMTMPIPAIMDDGLMQTAEGLKEAGSLLWTGTPLPQDLERLVETGVPVAANAKPFTDRSKMFAALEQIQKAGVRWVGVETDAGQGTKIHDRPVAKDCSPLSLNELKEIRKAVSGVLVFKGILSRWDAAKAVEAGADAVIVSNHGAHTLDYLPHPLQVMDEISTEIGGSAEIFMDGGIRRGADVIKGLAFGASLVGLGRPILYGLAAGGKDGVRDLIEEITSEMVRIMSLIGAAKPDRILRDHLIEDPA